MNVGKRRAEIIGSKRQHLITSNGVRIKCRGIDREISQQKSERVNQTYLKEIFISLVPARVIAHLETRQSKFINNTGLNDRLKALLTTLMQINKSQTKTARVVTQHQSRGGVCTA